MPGLHSIIARSKLNWRWKVTPEERECIEFYDRVRVAILEGRLHCVAFHVPNEGKRHKITGCIQKAMGMISGVADYCFLAHGSSGVIEMKIKPNKPTDNQQTFLGWCDAQGVQNAVCYSADEAEETLKTWGYLT